MDFSGSRWLIGSAVAATFWYVSLFPGRLGSDPIQAINLMENNQSTDWWSATYFWFLRITTFNGQSIWLSSLLSIVTLYLTLVYFLYSLPEKKTRIAKVAFFICLSPLFGNFAVNINHDVLFTSGIFLLLGYSLRNFLNNCKKIDDFVPYFAIVLFLNSKTGYFLIIAFLAYTLFTRRSIARVVGLVFFSFALFIVTSFGVTKSSVPMHYLPFLADIKCVAQHPEARINGNEWNFLVSIAPLENWKKPLTCSSMDIAISEVRSQKLEVVKLADFAKNYFSIASKNPAIVIQSHLQRSSIVLPPPFFQGPQNQIDRNIDNPVGLNSNIALQQGPEVLHPSIDYPPLKSNLSFLKPFESIALLGSFVINQASWFWGWGGLWLWPVFLYFMFTIKERRLLKLIQLGYPIILTHIILFLVGPIPAPRYIMCTILVGNILSVILISRLFEKTKYKGDVI
jgi:hypothetical protein